MKITDYIAGNIDGLPKGYVSTLTDFMGEVKRKVAVIKALDIMFF
ncbi:hypothetical protein PBT90_06055 [Algoriphagus halophytocola]|nr:hypothetical protein [Algoriphagus sp. TR-M9]WBL44250.1 hypothetical protein PBT90_06055 [Algoriphagus sp. TR-M9]